MEISMSYGCLDCYRIKKHILLSMYSIQLNERVEIVNGLSNCWGFLGGVHRFVTM